MKNFPEVHNLCQINPAPADGSYQFVNEFQHFSDDLSNESVEVLRERLNAMKRLVAERQSSSNTTPGTVEQGVDQK